MAKKKVKSSKRPAERAKAKTAKPAKKVSKQPPKKVAKKVVKKAPAKAAPRAPQSKPTPKGLAPGCNWVNPYLTVRNVAAALSFYQTAFGFKCRSKMTEPDGSLMHAELIHNDSLIMLGPESPGRGALAPTGPQGMNLFVYFENVDAVCARAGANGAKVLQPPTYMFWGDRVAVVMDPDGHTWWLGTHVKDVAPEDMHP
jgi:PhnB protein